MAVKKTGYGASILSRERPGDGKSVVVAMSGGVDSSVAALILKEQGYDVIGLALQVTDYSKYRSEEESGTCCSLQDMEDARRVAESIGIPFYVVDTEKSFDGQVVDYFVAEYLQGRTPNPCVMCNTKVKFNSFFRKALELGTDYIATGHYVRKSFDEGLGYCLLRGEDHDKDQSYFLFNLTQRQLEKTLFPVGGMKKEKVRQLAKTHKLPVADKPDSQEICFVPGNNYKKFIEERTPESQRHEGLIVTGKGIVLGNHEGIHNFTVGQRKGLGAALDLASKMGIANTEDFYVTKIDPVRRHVHLGPSRELEKAGLVVGQVNWTVAPKLEKARWMDVKIRYRAETARASVKMMGDNAVEVRFEKPQRAITPGQACVFYDGEVCLGGGWILTSLEVQADERPSEARQ